MNCPPCEGGLGGSRQGQNLGLLQWGGRFGLADVIVMALESIASEAAIQTNLERFLLVLSISLSVATLPQIFGWMRQIPYTLLLVIVGAGLAFVDVRLVNLSPELILSIFLPPLLFEAAWNLKWSNLKRDLVPISLYAVFWGCDLGAGDRLWATAVYVVVPGDRAAGRRESVCHRSHFGYCPLSRIRGGRSP